MNPEIKTKWVEALRSGKYKQGRNTLYSDGCFCCLGVLTDLYIQEHDEKWTIADGSETDLVMAFDGKYATLPSTVREWAGMNSNNPTMDVPPEEVQVNCGTTLAQLNDKARFNFNKLADLIEEQL